MKKPLLIACVCALLLMMFASCEPKIEELTPDKTEAELLAEYEPMFRAYLPYRLGEQIVVNMPDTAIVFIVTKDTISATIQQVKSDFRYEVEQLVTWLNNDVSITFRLAYENGWIGEIADEKDPLDEENEEYIYNTTFHKNNELSFVTKMQASDSVNDNMYYIFNSRDEYFENGIEFTSDSIITSIKGDAECPSYLTFIRSEGLVRMNRWTYEFNAETNHYDKVPVVCTIQRN